MKESFQFNQEADAKQEKPKTIFEKMKDLKKVAAFTALLAMASPSFASGAEKAKESPEKVKITQLEREKAKENILKLIDQLRESKNKYEASNPDKKDNATQESKMWTRVFGDGAKTTTSFDASKNNVIIEEGPSSAVTYVDHNSDGVVDRFIMNFNEDTPQEVKSMENKIDALSNLEFLAEQAQITKNFPDKIGKKVVCDFIEEQGKTTVKSIDFKTGDSNTWGSEDSEDYHAKVQKAFAEEIAKHLNELQQAK